MTLREEMKILFALSLAGIGVIVLGTIGRIIMYYDEDIEELHWQLKCLEEKISETKNHELKNDFKNISTCLKTRSLTTSS